MIDTLRRENALMHSALNDMNVDLHAYRSKLMARESENKQLEAEAAKLKIKTSRLLTTAEQQEFCDMGEVELVMKAEDVAAMGDDLRKCATYRDVVLIEKKQKLISRDLKRLKRFSNVMLQLLQLRPRFNTANLESRRLNMLQSLADLTGRMEVVNEVLLKSEVS
ncbi:hypothetical protein AGDE_00462 [Angomonas deanei]|nr:hypothetical protein AGDE_00462 [Angomonas deanei]|eukprot:EPY43459.1 hypothetical protein AGDE_00462 [Angomonas deanei]